MLALYQGNILRTIKAVIIIIVIEIVTFTYFSVFCVKNTKQTRCVMGNLGVVGMTQSTGSPTGLSIDQAVSPQHVLSRTAQTAIPTQSALHTFSLLLWALMQSHYIVDCCCVQKIFIVAL